MESFKKLFFANPLLFSGVAAAPSSSGALNIAATDARAVNDFAIESSDLNTIDARATSKKKTGATESHELERRVLYAGTNANQVLENEYVDAMQIINNGGKATVADLSGCTALFSYMDKTLRYVVHILCGNEATDAKTAVQAAVGADSVTIGAKDQNHYNAAVNAIRAIIHNFTVNDRSPYDNTKFTDTIGITLTSVIGATTIVEGTGPRICKQSHERFEAFKQLARAAKQHGSLVVGQVGHPGRQKLKILQPGPISASDVQLVMHKLGSFTKPHPLSRNEIHDIICCFVHASVCLQKAGYDGTQLHAAHGYLLDQYFSQTTNKRSDKYGGSLENRARITMEIAQAIRKAIPASGFMVGIKINSVNFQTHEIIPREAKSFA
ncbi:hypothetical protein BOTCAL_0132g00210 [Botryotinia calthae]|uniref:NADH:flavin oxidoreductase/NADH oxidase N-terminal domain-containing protein n=1 Tax=Botryotinia calthae TaxID=38488 RepID=A0A4Y8D3R9_9HELO|nr:hypothetical protein BOTCAL_0132g00210 [Botryotinia calthae]